MASVEFTPDAVRDFLRLDGSDRKAVLKGLLKLQDSPEQRGAPLGRRSTSDLTGLRKLPAGRNKGIRIVYKVEPDGSASVVYVIAGRADKECYRLAVERIEQIEDEATRAQLSEIIERAWNV